MLKIHIKRFFLFLFYGFLLISSDGIAKSNDLFSVTHYGNFTQMMEVGEAPGNVLLKTLPARSHLYGLGALQSLQGEITIIDGEQLISRGADNDGRTTQVTAQDNATLLATATIKHWLPVPIPANITQASFEKFVLVASSKAGIPNNVSFPFVVKGEIKNLQWHVVNGLKPREINTGFYADKKRFEAASITGMLIGFYTGKQLEGIISHTGKRFHVHFADAKLTHAGHVDEYVIGTNATLFLPKK